VGRQSKDVHDASPRVIEIEGRRICPGRAGVSPEHQAREQEGMDASIHGM
jgi:hypothetical protein